MPLLYPYAAGPSAPPSYSFVFPTDLGCFYAVEFFNKATRFSGNEILFNEGLMYEIIVTRSYLDPPPQRKERKFDSLVKPTLIKILDDFIRAGGISPVYFYVCENLDEKEAARRKLFAEIWYMQSSLDEWHLYNHELKESEADPAPWFLGLLIHENHMHNIELPRAFEAFMQNEVTKGKIVQITRLL
jgi:hypothetical protein